MLKGLFLPGYACTTQIWQPVYEKIKEICEAGLVDWPAEVTPGFDGLDDFADWLYETYWPEEYDFIAGHSLGGLVALQLLASSRVTVPRVILVETFLLPPGPFFRNLVLHETNATRIIPEMLEREGEHYSAHLREAIREVDMSEQVLKAGGRLYALYGDRGCRRPERVQEELRWPEEMAAGVEVSVIPEACHFPMLENPEAAARTLRRVLNG